MFLTFTGVTFNGEKVESNSIIQKEMPDGWHILISRNGGWVRIKNDSLLVDGLLIEDAFKKGFELSESTAIKEAHKYQ